MAADGTLPMDFAAIVRPHLRQLYRLAYRLTGSPEDAEDLVQEALIKIHARADELTSIAALGPWACRVLYNQFIDNARRYAKRRLRTVSLDGAAEGSKPPAPRSESPTPDEAALRECDISALRRGLDQLSLEHRAVLLMHDAEGYKLEEIQIITGISIGTLKSRLHRARARLRALLGADGTF